MSLAPESSTVPHFWLPNGGPQLTSGDQRCVSESHSRSELSVSTLATIGLANTSLTLEASTVPHFWLPDGGPQLTSGDQRCVSESHSRSELSV